MSSYISVVLCKIISMQLVVLQSCKVVLTTIYPLYGSVNGRTPYHATEVKLPYFIRSRSLNGSCDCVQHHLAATECVLDSRFLTNRKLSCHKCHFREAFKCVNGSGLLN